MKFQSAVQVDSLKTLLLHAYRNRVYMDKSHPGHFFLGNFQSASRNTPEVKFYQRSTKAVFMKMLDIKAKMKAWLNSHGGSPFPFDSSNSSS